MSVLNQIENWLTCILLQNFRDLELKIADKWELWSKNQKDTRSSFWKRSVRHRARAFISEQNLHTLLATLRYDMWAISVIYKLVLVLYLQYIWVEDIFINSLPNGKCREPKIIHQKLKKMIRDYVNYYKLTKDLYITHTKVTYHPFIHYSTSIFPFYWRCGQHLAVILMVTEDSRNLLAVRYIAGIGKCINPCFLCEKKRQEQKISMSRQK